MSEKEWVSIRICGITFAQGYKCAVCGVIGCNTIHPKVEEK